MKSALLIGAGIATALTINSAQGQRLELTGEAALETRLFPRAPLFADQSRERVSPSFAVTPEFLYESHGGKWRFTAIGFVRFAAHDSRRSHADVRELGILYIGNGMTAFVGVGKVFWGVAEVSHLVDVINQTDAVEDIDGEDKLGQPMVNLTLEGWWGSLDLFYLPFFRERTFPAVGARLRGPLGVSTHAKYGSSAGRWHQDFALRWSRPVDAFDIGVSFFRGTSREPRFVPAGTVSSPSLVPTYDVIDQIGLDAQWTGPATLLKVEAMTRGGHGHRFLAATGGIEHTLFGLFSSASDVGLLAEIMIDGRGDDAPVTVFDNDVFVGFRWALNDVDDTAILGGPVVDYETGEVLALVEAERRIADRWRFAVEARLFANSTCGTSTSSLRRDGFLAIRLSRHL